MSSAFEFKPGDKVITSRYGKYGVAMVLGASSDNPLCYAVRYENFKGYDDLHDGLEAFGQDYHSVYPSDMTLVEEKVVDKAFDFKPGDLVKLTGRGWDKFGLRNEEAEIVGRDEVGPKVALQHDDGQNYRVVCNEQFGDYSAELVEAAPLAPTNEGRGSLPQVPGYTVEDFKVLGDAIKRATSSDVILGGKMKFTQVAGDVNPSHYDFPGGVQVIDITKHLDFLTGNVVKYVSRAGRKGDRMTDLLKAKKYLDWAIEQEEGK